MLCALCFCKQSTAYEMRMGDWSSDVCSSDLRAPRDDAFTAGEAATVKALAALQDGDTVEAGDGARRFLAPASLAALAELYATHPEATLTAGSTDVGLWVAKNFQRPERGLHPGRVTDKTRKAGVRERGGQ